MNVEVNVAVNDEISAKVVRVIDFEGENLGVMSLEAALKEARKREMDLVEIQPAARPVVCKILDYGKFVYQKTKRVKKQKAPEAKTVQISPNTEKHDLETKGRQAVSFLEKGHTVKVLLRMKGRQQAHQDFSMKKLKTFVGEYISAGIHGDVHVQSDREISITIKPGE